MIYSVHEYDKLHPAPSTSFLNCSFFFFSFFLIPNQKKKQKSQASRNPCQCGKAFADQSACVKHPIRHTGVKPYHCNHRDKHLHLSNL